MEYGPMVAPFTMVTVALDKAGTGTPPVRATFWLTPRETGEVIPVRTAATTVRLVPLRQL